MGQSAQKTPEKRRNSPICTPLFLWIYYRTETEFLSGLFLKRRNEIMEKRFTIRDIAEIGVLAALVFVATAFIKIGPIPTPAGPTMIKSGYIVCLLGALLFGKTKGGLAAGIGSMLYDLTDPAFTASAPFTFLFFFAMAFVCGAVSHTGEPSRKRDLTACAVGAGTYLVLHLGKSLITLLLEGSGLAAALAACGLKFVTSGLNAAIAVFGAWLLAPVFRKALKSLHR
jgi:uncharacterized membrane protein